MPRSSSGVPCRPPAMRATCTDTPGGAMRQNSVSIVVLIEGTSRPILPRHPYMSLSSKSSGQLSVGSCQRTAYPLSTISQTQGSL
jgi:hypothetical protein